MTLRASSLEILIQCFCREAHPCGPYASGWTLLGQKCPPPCWWFPKSFCLEMPLSIFFPYRHIFSLSTSFKTCNLYQHHFSGIVLSRSSKWSRIVTLYLTSFTPWSISSLPCPPPSPPHPRNLPPEVLPVWTLFSWNLVLCFAFRCHYWQVWWFTALLSSLSLSNLIYSPA